MSPGSSAAYHGVAIRPHDLLWVAELTALVAVDPLPLWATAEWLDGAAPVVVRRERANAFGRIPVGLRGKTRSERFKAYLARHAIRRCVTPDMLANNAAWDRKQELEEFPPIEALIALAPLLDATGLPWGPTGSVGFALASGLPVLRQDSDLDLVVRASKPLTPDLTEALLSIRSSTTCRIDMQIETGHGAFSFAEWVNGPRRVLLKTDIGPFLTDDPWNQSGGMPAESTNQS